MAVPDVRVECAFTSSVSTASPVWRDISPYTRILDGVTYNRGRSDEVTGVQSGRMDFTVDNTSGIFTPGSAAALAQWGTALKIRRPVRLRIRTATTAGNLLTAEQSSFEAGTTGGWIPIGGAAIANDSTVGRAQDGSKSLLTTWPAVGIGGAATLLNYTGFVIGRTYTLSMYVYVPTGSPSVAATCSGIAVGTTMSTKDAITRCSVTFTATAGTHSIGIVNASVAGAGQQAWMDAVMLDEGSTVGTFTTAAPPIYDLWTGSVDDWGTTWMGGVRGLARVTCSDRIARLERRPLRSLLEQEILVDTPLAYYMLSEDSTSTTAGDTSGRGQVALAATQVGAGGTLEFGSGTGPGFDGLSAAVFTPASVSNGLYLGGSSPTVLTADVFVNNNVTLEAFVNTSTAAVQTIARAADAVGSYISLEVTAASKLMATVYDAASGTTVGTVTSASNVTGGTKHVAATVTVTGTSATLTLYLDGASAGTAGWTQSSGLLYGWTSIRVGGGGGITGTTGCITGTLSHVALFSSALSGARILAHRNAGINGATGDTTSARFNRICNLAGMASASYSATTGLSTMGPQPLSGKSVAAALQECADAEQGVIYVNGSGVVVFAPRTARYNVSSILTLAPTDVGPDLGFTTNDAYMANEVQVSRVGGATYTYQDATSRSDYDPIRRELSIFVDSDGQALALCQWLSATGANPGTRAGQVTVDAWAKRASVSIAAIAALEVGNVITLSPLPTAAPASSVPLFVEGLSGTIGAAWTVSLSTSPVSAGGSVWQLDSATYSQLDSTTILAF